MAYIDDLISRIPDVKLRGQIADEVSKILERTDFGLVFQRHLPEDLEVPGVRPRRGDDVRVRTDPSKQNHVVLSTRAGVASIVAVDAAKQAAEDAEPNSHLFEDLVVVKDFDTPIYPGLKLIQEVTRGGSKPFHIVMEGENYHALETLLYTHDRTIDAIYLDPPYNTGADEWIYNDRYVSSADSYRHSKWLSFIERRLIHAKRLLKRTGVIIVAIGDDEHHRLRMLLDQVFGATNFISDVVWKGGRKNDSRYISNGADYMLIYANDESALAELGVRWREPKPGLDAAMASARRIWEKSDGDHAAATTEWRRWLRAFKQSGDASDAVTRFTSLDHSGRPIRTDGNLRSPNPRPNLQYDLLHPVTQRPVRMHPNGWRYSRETMTQMMAQGLIHFGADETTGAAGIVYLDELDQQVAESVFERDRNPSGKRLVEVLGERRFPYPKDHEVLMRWIGLVAPEDGVILDFFGGSGATTEAVMRLNARDGGTRQSILVTNNELSATTASALQSAGHLPGDAEWEAEGVFTRVTLPRISTVATGVRPDGSIYSEGLDENVAFYRLTYEDENLVALGRKFEAIAPLLWLKAGGQGSVVRRKADDAWSLPDDASYGILFDTAQAKLFADAVARRTRQVSHIFIVTDYESAFQSAVGYLPLEQRITTTRLYADYLHSFEINGRN
ncbi:site-specific DNA-methyltransferase [Curtobacterium sp. VKM Ac-2865]|uniref:site-specific DNA-methyltransferase n=1 Tax=Curtobacterium sp. VKM Ac-2865 TaxID=2783817 RepID=UPI00188A907E|nr:site-specific DNA-methyltransferase [Curtobacterium sp. VKM Ac-2865]MBF4581997.1 site-specific DNA-methyltransferase [Curtobacterium sp. VKM Ac-2865]